ncbi:unnamed protein product, partial [Heterosigma akashiwo]
CCSTRSPTSGHAAGLQVEGGLPLDGHPAPAAQHPGRGRPGPPGVQGARGACCGRPSSSGAGPRDQELLAHQQGPPAGSGWGLGRRWRAAATAAAAPADDLWGDHSGLLEASLPRMPFTHSWCSKSLVCMEARATE